MFMSWLLPVPKLSGSLTQSLSSKPFKSVSGTVPLANLVQSCSPHANQQSGAAWTTINTKDSRAPVKHDQRINLQYLYCCIPGSASTGCKAFGFDRNSPVVSEVRCSLMAFATCWARTLRSSLVAIGPVRVVLVRVPR